MDATETVKTRDLEAVADQLGALIDANVGLRQRLDKVEREKAELVRALEDLSVAATRAGGPQFGAGGKDRDVLAKVQAALAKHGAP